MENSPEASLSKALKAAGLHVTAQRLAVHRAVRSRGHATADEVREQVQREIGVVSRQAVYDALYAMSEHGLLRRVQPAGSVARYETRVDNHHHLICRSCGTMVDVDCSVGEAPCMEPENTHGYHIDEAEVIYWGKCPDCHAGS